MALILERLGFPPQQVYEKYRETFHLHGVDLVLDELPYGTFLELEGSEEAIREMTAVLDLNWEQRILANYLGMMDLLQRKHHLPFYDLTFANFEGRNLSIWDLFPLLSSQYTEE
jgi:adenylate cyclase class 2